MTSIENKPHKRWVFQGDWALESQSPDERDWQHWDDVPGEPYTDSFDGCLLSIHVLRQMSEDGWADARFRIYNVDNDEFVIVEPDEEIDIEDLCARHPDWLGH